MHTLWMREHNRIAQELGDLNPHWDGDKVYHEARKIVGAEMQHISYNEWLPKILGPQGMALLGSYSGYEPNIDAGIVNAFATAAFRFGHGLINPIIFPSQLILPAYRTRAAKSRDDKHQLINSELTERLFEMAHEIALDLGALNIQRGRDHALPGYNRWRGLCNLSVAETFDDFKNEIVDSDIRVKLQELYKDPSNVDLWVGGLLEELVPGSLLGQTFSCIIAEQFRRTRAGDRFWYESPSTFDHSQLIQIKQTSLASVLCDNGDAIDRVQRDVFLRATYPTGYVACSSIPRMDLRMWKYCEDGHCSSPDRTPTFTNHVQSRRFKRSVDKYNADTEAPELDEMEFKDLYDEERPVISPTEVENDEGIDLLSEQKDLGLSERVQVLEQTVASMAATLTKLGEAFDSLKNQANEIKVTAATKGVKGCGVVQGAARYEADIWQKNVCTQCSCKEGEIQCIEKYATNFYAKNLLKTKMNAVRVV
ncbi:hypothetical protein OS493_015772 [Desmophyllum pertusum]|uniref:Peroxidasin n=1 Tax=Desmophyllum pertusum TaxID=174260 RepID=A0A9W9YCQ8_9CNID|nr:hypothetical protein OS493_015772 [Desmophyllum pertusum]